MGAQNEHSTKTRNKKWTDYLENKCTSYTRGMVTETSKSSFSNDEQHKNVQHLYIFIYALLQLDRMGSCVNAKFDSRFVSEIYVSCIYYKMCWIMAATNPTNKQHSHDKLKHSSLIRWNEQRWTIISGWSSKLLHKLYQTQCNKLLSEPETNVTKNVQKNSYLFVYAFST